MKIIIPAPGGNNNTFTHIVDKKISFLVGLHTLDWFKWNLLTAENLLQCVSGKLLMTLTRKLGHIFLT